MIAKMTPTPDAERPPPILEYGRPARPVNVRRVFAGVFGIAAGFCAVPLIVLGIGWMVYAFTAGRPHIDREDDLRKGVLLVAIGGVLAAASWRWCRYAFRISAKAGRK